MDNTNVHAEGFDIDEYLEKWDEENAQEPEAAEENEETEAETAETPANEAETDAEENTEADENKNETETDTAITDVEPDDAKAEDNAEEISAEEPKTEEPATTDKSSNYEKRFNDAIAEISAKYPEVKGIGDIKDVRTFAILTTVGGMSNLEAYEMLNKNANAKESMPSAQATPDEIAAAEARGAQRAASKSHLKSSVPKMTSDASDMLSDDEAENYAELLGVTVAEAKKLHKRVNK